MAKTLTDKLNGSKIELDHIVNQANSEIDMLNQKLQSPCEQPPMHNVDIVADSSHEDVALDNDRLQTENQGLAAHLKDRTKKHQEVRDLYDRLKQKQMTTATQFAARNAAYESIEEAENATLNETPQSHSGMNRVSLNHHDREFGTHFHRQGGNNEQGREGMMPPPRFASGAGLQGRVREILSSHR